MRRFFKFLFRHKWALHPDYRVPTLADMAHPNPPKSQCRLVCLDCGALSEWHGLFDPDANHEICSRRGCPGK